MGEGSSVVQSALGLSEEGMQLSSSTFLLLWAAVVGVTVFQGLPQEVLDVLSVCLIVSVTEMRSCESGLTRGVGEFAEVA